MKLKDYYGDPPADAGLEPYIYTLDGELLPGEDVHCYMGEHFATLDGVNAYAANIAAGAELVRFARQYREYFSGWLRDNMDTVFDMEGCDMPSADWLVRAARAFAGSIEEFYDWLECERT